MVALNSAEQSLSRMGSFGKMLTVLRWSIRVWYAWIILPTVLFFMSSTRILLLLTLLRTIMDWFPQLNFFRNCPGWLVKIFWVALSSKSKMQVKTVHSFLIGCGMLLSSEPKAVVLSYSASVFNLVDCSLLGNLLPCPFGVSLESG